MLDIKKYKGTKTAIDIIGISETNAKKLVAKLNSIFNGWKEIYLKDYTYVSLLDDTVYRSDIPENHKVISYKDFIQEDTKLIKGAYYDVSINSDGSYIIKFKCIDDYGYVIASEYYLDGEIIKTNTEIGEIDTFPMVKVSGYPTINPTFSSEPLFKEDEVITDPYDLIPGKWYFNGGWEIGSCCKFKEFDGHRGIYYSEKFIGGTYTRQNSKWGLMDSKFTLVPLSHLKKFLPQDHPDLKEQANSYKQINKQTNGKTNSDSKDSELSIKVPGKSPKIGEIKGTRASGVHGRRARAVIGRYSPQNKAINSRS